MLTRGARQRMRSPFSMLQPLTRLPLWYIQLLWARGHPLGSASVPEVQQREKTSLGSVVTADSSSSSTSPLAISRSSSRLIKLRNPSLSPISRWPNPLKSLRVMKISDLVNSRTYPTSLARHWMGTGESVPPARVTARYSAASSQVLGSCTITTSSFWRPARNKAVAMAVSYTHLRAHETKANLVCRLLLEKKKT